MPDLSGDAIPVDDLEAEIALRLGAVPRPVDWRQLDHDSASVEWSALDEWVRWLVGRYDLDGRELPPCWHQHGPLTEELSGLRGAHLVAFDPTQPASAASDWHRILWDTRVRLRDAVARSGCTERNHNETLCPDWVSSSAYAVSLAATVRADIAQRDQES